MTNVLDTSLNHERVSDRILYALELALEKAMTRNAGGGMFVERRDYPERIQTALDRLKSLKS